jgi:hypothetical protein
LPPILETVSLKDYGLGRRKNEPVRVWYGQPVLTVTGAPPYEPVIGPKPSALEILRAILSHADLLAHDNGAIVALPELSIRFAEIAEVRKMIAAAPVGTLVVFGAGQMTAAQALSIENKPALWEGDAAGRYANCAVVGMGGHDQLFLQPKLLRSAWEQDWHWPGRIVRCFTGSYVRFTTFICSDLLNRPGNSSYLNWLHEELERDSEKLTFALWLQHNQKPRSSQFSNAIDTVGRMNRATIVVVGSRMASREKRFENYAVSGAFVSRSAFPSDFNKFTHRFHYVEQANAEVSRAVLLRYDADAYQVKTVLADALDVRDRVEKGELFDSSQPYLLQDGKLTPSSDNVHIEDLCSPAREALVQRDATLDNPTRAITQKLSDIGTSEFLAFLDSAIVPQTPEGERAHVAGQRHEGGDLRCRCWKHRVCIDTLTEPSGSGPLEAILEGLGDLERGRCDPRPRYNERNRTNVELVLSGGSTSGVALIYPFDYSLEGLQKRLFGERPPVLETHFVLVAELTQDRPKVETIDVAEAPTAGAVDPGKGSGPTLTAVRLNEVRRAVAANDLVGFFEQVLRRTHV